jgi:alpha-ketoglutarate-dependent taurine dioxygenase
VSVGNLAQSEQILRKRPNLWLRDVCPCEKCVDPHSGQKSFATTQLDFLPEVKSVERGDDGSLTVVWANDPTSGGQDHTSVYPPTIEDGFFKILRRDLWNREIFEKDQQKCRVSYQDWIAGGSEFWDAMASLASKGLIFVYDVPQGDEQAVERIGEQIGALQETFYGRTWDVVSKPQAENVAYTNQFLGLHQDLLYYPDPPRIQLLHCLANECDGGESLFSDGVYAAATIAFKRQDTFQTLASQPTAYHYNKNGNVYYAERPIVKASHGDTAPTLVDNVWWSPPFQAQFPIDHHKMANWYLAAKQFHTEIERPEHMVEYRLQAGECVVFDNWRVLHGRREFNSAAGKRHLKGTYVDDRTYRARYDDMPAPTAAQHNLWTDRLAEHAQNQHAVRYGSRSQKVLAYLDDPTTRTADTLLYQEREGGLAKRKAAFYMRKLLGDKHLADSHSQTREQRVDEQAEGPSAS